MFILQAINLFHITRPKTFIPLLVIITVIVVLIVVSIVLKHQKVTGGNSSGTYTLGSIKNSSLRKLAIIYNMNKEQIHFLKTICRKESIDNPEFYLRNEESTDRFFKGIYHQINESKNSEKEHEKTILFSIRDAIEQKRREEKTLTTTKNISTDQEFTIMTKKGEQYPSSLIKNTPDGLFCEVPRDLQKNEIQMPVMSKVSVFFYIKTGTAYTFQGRIIRYDTEADHSLMVIAHTDSLTAFRSRKFLRKDFNAPCTFYTVDPKQNAAAPRKFRGSMSDISPGGCSIKTLTPAGEKRYINIEFQISEDSADTVIGTVIKLNKLDTDTGYIMHIRFTKMSRKTQNRIFSFIYEYDRLEA